MKNTKVSNTKHILTENSPFVIKEAYKATRTNINFTLSSVKGCKVIALTSSLQNEGKSTTCINLAISFSQANNRVLVIDADMRKRTVHKLVDIENQSGLSNVLVGFTKLNEIIVHTKYGFDVITSGPTPPNPSELLGSEVMGELIEVLKDHYDYIFIDTPPVNVVSDALNIANCVSGYIVVVKNGETTYDDVENIKNKVELANSKILGFILNATKKHGSYSGYKRYNKYKYYRYTSSYNTDLN